MKPRIAADLHVMFRSKYGDQSLDFLSLLDKYPAAISGVFGAAIGVIGSLAGVAITSWFNLKAKDKEAATARSLRRLAACRT